MKKLKIYWPTVAAVILAVSLVSCHNAKVQEQNEKTIIEQNRITFENTYQKSDFTLHEVELEELIIPEELEKEADFSK